MEESNFRAYHSPVLAPRAFVLFLSYISRLRRVQSLLHPFMFIFIFNIPYHDVQAIRDGRDATSMTSLCYFCHEEYTRACEQHHLSTSGITLSGLRVQCSYEEYSFLQQYSDLQARPLKAPNDHSAVLTCLSSLRDPRHCYVLKTNSDSSRVVL